MAVPKEAGDEHLADEIGLTAARHPNVYWYSLAAASKRNKWAGDLAV